MGTVIERQRRDGSITYSAQISIMRAGAIAHRESKTFRDKKMAAGWLAKREAELSKPGGITAAKIGKETLGDAIDKYIATSRKEIGKTKAQVLETLKGFDISQKRCADIRAQDIVDLAETLSTGRQPQTVGNYLSHLQAVFSVAKHAWGMDLDAEAMAGAAKVAKRLGLTSKSASRDRRPTLAELDKLMDHFAVVETRRNSIPMRKIIPFAIFSTRRQDEISRLSWTDLEPGRVMVRDMKHPGEKAGNDTWCDLVSEAEALIQSMAKIGAEIFPASADAMSAAFTRACKLLGIEDLHFHDLRHEGVSRLFEMGWNIPHVAAVSGHRSWQSLKRYTHLRSAGDKYANWKWKDGT